MKQKGNMAKIRTVMNRQAVDSDKNLKWLQLIFFCNDNEYDRLRVHFATGKEGALFQME